MRYRQLVVEEIKMAPEYKTKVITLSDGVKIKLTEIRRAPKNTRYHY